MIESFVSVDYRQSQGEKGFLVYEVMRYDLLKIVRSRMA